MGIFDKATGNIQAGNGKQAGGQTEGQQSHQSNDELVGKLNAIENQLNEIKGKMASQSAVHEIWDNGHGLNQIFDLVKDIKSSLTTTSNSGISQEQINQITNKLTLINSQIATKITESEGKINSSLSSVISKLNDLKSSLGKIKQGDSFEFKSEHRTYLTWTTIFAVILIFSSIFIVRGYLVDFPNLALLTWTFVVFCLTLVTVGVFNLVFSMADIDIYTADGARRAYYIICGVLIALTFSMSAAVLLI
ncbi:MAG TPA: hypothetical protein PKV66_05435 [Candidatus Pelethenecus sp.]|nr:hypothetical protein [Candidatus Pelethenecus sp.]